MGSTQGTCRPLLACGSWNSNVWTSASFRAQDLLSNSLLEGSESRPICQKGIEQSAHQPILAEPECHYSVSFFQKGTPLTCVTFFFLTAFYVFLSLIHPAMAPPSHSSRSPIFQTRPALPLCRCASGHKERIGTPQLRSRGQAGGSTEGEGSQGRAAAASKLSASGFCH